MIERLNGCTGACFVLRIACSAGGWPRLPVFPGGRALHREARGAKLCAGLCQTLCGYVRLCALMCGFWKNEEKRRPKGQKLFLRPDCDGNLHVWQSVACASRFRSLPLTCGWRGRVGEAIRHRKSGFSTPSAAFRRLPPPSAAFRRLPPLGWGRRTGKRPSDQISAKTIPNNRL